MPDRIWRGEYTKADIPLKEFANFQCGTDPWAIEVSDWITGRDKSGAEYLLRKKRCRVFYYRSESGNGPIIGFGSLGGSNWFWPEDSPARTKIAVIPCCGLSLEFHGQPPPLLGERYSDQIIADLIIEAASSTQSPILGLFVHPQNAAAIKLYRRNGFATVSPSNDYVRMVIDLSSLR